MSDWEINSGKILLAEPFMIDPNFKRATILLFEHEEEGSLGFIMNKRLDSKISELIGDFPEFNSPVYFGGPVQTDTIHYIHNVGNLLDDSQKIEKGIYLGGDFEKLKFLIASDMIKPSNIKFFRGYCGWSPGQLSEEMSYGSWITAEMDSNYLFKGRPEQLWKKIMRNKGRNYTVIAQMPDDIICN